MEQVKVGQVYRHFKGNTYEVLNVALCSAKKTEVVVYRDVKDSKSVWVRPIEEFTDIHPSGAKRFVLTFEEIRKYRISEFLEEVAKVANESESTAFLCKITGFVEIDCYGETPKVDFTAFPILDKEELEENGISVAHNENPEGYKAGKLYKNFDEFLDKKQYDLTELFEIHTGNCFNVIIHRESVDKPFTANWYKAECDF